MEDRDALAEMVFTLSIHLLQQKVELSADGLG